MLAVAPADLFRTITAVLDDDLHARIDDLADRISANAWIAGDLVIDVYNHVVANGIVGITMSEICAYISDVLGGEYAPGTLRVYAAVSKFFPPSVRGRYPPSMPYSIFRFAAGQSDNWRVVMDWAMDFLAERGRPPSLRELRQKFRQVEFAPSPPERFPVHLDPPEAVTIEYAAETSAPLRADEIEDLQAIYDALIRLQARARNQVAKTILSQVVTLLRQLIAVQ